MNDDGPPIVRYRIQDDRRGNPVHDITLPTSRSGLDQLVTEGWLHLPGALPRGSAAEVADVVTGLAELELGDLGARRLRGNGYYVRDLERKDATFDPYLTWSPMLSLARAVLGPQVRVRLDARIAFAGDEGAGVPWHIHLPAVPEPLPPFWSHPHSVAALVYLDDVDEAEGALVVAPGTHLDASLRSGLFEDGERPVIRLLPRRGDVVVMHGNLWHRTEPATAGARHRRILFVGYTAAWVVSDARAIGQPDPGAWSGRSREPDLGPTVGTDEADELLGRFRW